VKIRNIRKGQKVTLQSLEYMDAFELNGKVGLMIQREEIENADCSIVAMIGDDKASIAIKTSLVTKLNAELVIHS